LKGYLTMVGEGIPNRVAQAAMLIAAGAACLGAYETYEVVEHGIGALEHQFTDLEHHIPGLSTSLKHDPIEAHAAVRTDTEKTTMANLECPPVTTGLVATSASEKTTFIGIPEDAATISKLLPLKWADCEATSLPGQTSDQFRTQYQITFDPSGRAKHVLVQVPELVPKLVGVDDLDHRICESLPANATSEQIQAADQKYQAEVAKGKIPSCSTGITTGFWFNRASNGTVGGIDEIMRQDADIAAYVTPVPPNVANLQLSTEEGEILGEIKQFYPYLNILTDVTLVQPPDSDPYTQIEAGMNSMLQSENVHADYSHMRFELPDSTSKDYSSDTVYLILTSDKVHGSVSLTATLTPEQVSQLNTKYSF
jgi:hypothetical protein